MTLLPVADGARLLGIHPKTLHHWLKEAQVPLATHPTDARINCVTEEHLQQVASLHDRPLQASRLVSVPEKEREPASTSRSLPISSLYEADQIQRLASLEAKVLTLQEQMA